jgi:hypothetical protein
MLVVTKKETEKMPFELCRRDLTPQLNTASQQF